MRVAPRPESNPAAPERAPARSRRPAVPAARRFAASVGLPVGLTITTTHRPAIERLRGRSLGRKRSLAVREFGLGIETLERFVRGEPLYRVHECPFGVLAMESEPVDPRL